MSTSHLARTRSQKRSWLAKLLRISCDAEVRRYCVEPLERRELMAADLGDYFSVNSFEDTSANSAVYTQQAPLSLNAEGEPGPDLVAFATLLRDAGVTMYGAAWDTDTSDQLRLFEDGAAFIDFVDVTNADRTPNSIATAEQITDYPTWKFQNGTQPQVGILTLQQLSTLSGIAIPQSSSPFLRPISNTTVEINSPLHIPVDAYDPNGNPITVTVSSSNPSAITAEVISGGRSARISTNFGDMTFRLFESESGRAAARFIALAQSGFYNTTNTANMIFHRVDDGFVIQGGDPLGLGTGGSQLGNFDDQFNVNLQHNRSGVLSFAKSSDDTNDSQFFVTEVATQFLNGNHSVFGQLVEGESVREAISGTSVNSSDRPTNPVIIQSITIFNDQENGLVRLRSVGTAGQTSNITVTVTDSEGNSTSRVFTATVANKSSNDQPFLSDFNDEVTTSINQAVTVQLASQDAEGDAVTYFVSPRGSSDPLYTASVNSSGLVTITPPTGFTGTFNVVVGVRAASGTVNSPTDLQSIQVTVQDNRPPAPTGIDLSTASDSGSSSSDNITNAASMEFVISGTQAGATVELLRNGQVVASQVASGTTTTLTTTAISSAGAGSYTLTARQTANSQTSLLSSALTITYDPTAPVQVTAGQIPSSATVGVNLNLNLSHGEEGSGLVYALTTAPSGATINASTGLITWTPTTQQVGAQAFVMTLTDLAGNVTTQNLSINVVQPMLVSYTLSFRDMNGNPITEVAVGETFKLRLSATDLRTVPEGVFSAFADILYNQTLIEAVGTNPFTFLPGILDLAGDVATPGLINEVGGTRTSIESPGETLNIVDITLRAKAIGQATFTTESADAPGSDTALLLRSGAVPLNQILYNSASLAIGRTFDSINDNFSVNEDSSSNSLNVLSNDTIRSGSLSNLTITAVSSPSSGGSVSISGQNLLYTPAANFVGTETFTYTVRDANNVEDTATVTITVNDINDPPVAVADTFTVNVGSTGNVLNVLANDSQSPDTGETLRVIAVGTTSNQGTVTIGANGANLIYTPASSFDGVETFTYTLSDGRGGVSTGSVSINVGPQVPPPTAVADSCTVIEDASSATFNVLANDIPSVSGETLSIDSVTASNGGVVSVTAGGGSITYRPAANFAGTETVTYRLRGSNGGRTFGTVTFTVTPVNDAPVANDDSLTINSNATQTLNVLANDTTVDVGETLRITAVSAIPSAQGSLSISSDSLRIIYTPPTDGFEGTITFTYTLGDGTSLSDTATVTLTVRKYTPRAIGGRISLSQSVSGSSVSGIQLTITGTATTGEAVSQQVTTDSTGAFQAANLPPGQYTVTLNPLAFRRNATQTLTITSNPEDGDSLNNVLSIGDVLPQFVNFRDFLRPAIQSSFSTAVSAGSSQQWIFTTGDWRGFKSVTTTLNSDASQLTIRTTTNANVVNTQTINVRNNANVIVRAVENGVYYIQVIGTPASFNLPTPSAADVTANTSTFAAVQTQSNSSSVANQSASAFDLALQSLDEDDVTFRNFVTDLDVSDDLSR